MIGINSIFFEFGSLQIKWYSIMILIAVCIVLFLVEKEAKRLRIDNEFVFNALFWSFIMGIIGARLYYVFFKIEDYMIDPVEIFKVWNGGLAIHGGILFGIITLYLYCKKYKVRCIRIMDLVAVPLILGQAIGRWGNFFNQEAFGINTTAATLKSIFVPNFIIEGMTIDGVVRVPTFYFESIACIIGFLILLKVRKSRYVKVGEPTAGYLIIYGIIRFVIEFYRTDALKLNSLRVAQFVSIIMIITGIIILYKSSKKSKYEDLYNDKKNHDEIKGKRR